jgi:hypothetical protein
MKILSSNAILTFAVIVFFGSCTLEKRLYRPGFNIELKGFKHLKNDQGCPTDDLTTESKTDLNRSSTLSMDKQLTISEVPVVHELEHQSFQPPMKVKSFHLRKNSKNFGKNIQASGITNVIVQKDSEESELKMDAKLDKRMTSLNNAGGNDLLQSIAWIILLAGIVTLIILGLFIGFVLFIKILLFLLSLLLIAFLIYVFSVALL